MCFRIDEKAVRPRQSVAWKVVHLKRDGTLESEFNHSSQGQKARWSTFGGVVRRGWGEKRDGVYAHSGIYVYLSEARAVQAAYDDYHCVLRVEVDPKDWLFSSCAKRPGTVATYSKVVNSWNQPYLRFLD